MKGIDNKFVHYGIRKDDLAMIETIDDRVIRDLYGVSGSELQDIRTAIAGLQKGELIIKDQMAFALGMGNKYKKINVTHLI